MRTEPPAKVAPARIDEFAKSLGVHVATIYRLPNRLRPKSVKLGGVRLVIEPLDAYLQRLEKLQAAPFGNGWSAWK